MKMHPTSEMMSKCRKWHLREPKFAKFPGEACPQTPLKSRAFGHRVSAANKYLPKNERTPLNRIHPTDLFQLYVEHEVGVFLTVFSCHSTVCRVVSYTVLEMESKLEQLGFEVSFNPPGDGDCFYSSGAKALGIPSQTLKNVVFDYLRNHQFDVSIYSLLWYDKDKSVLSSDSDQL